MFFLPKHEIGVKCINEGYTMLKTPDISDGKDLLPKCPHFLIQIFYNLFVLWVNAVEFL
jgi:hypothetical protein